MTGFTILGMAVFVILGTLLVGAVLSGITTYANNELFYPLMFFISWLTSTAFLIIKLLEPYLEK